MKNGCPTFHKLPKDEQELIVRTYDAGQHLYFIKAKGHNIVKIGVAKDPIQRLKDLQTGSPIELRLLFVLPYGGYMTESRLHKYFSPARKHGEWFDYNNEVKLMIKDMKQILKEKKWPQNWLKKTAV